MDEHHNRPGYKLIEYDDYWVVPLEENTIARVEVGYSLELAFLDANQRETRVWVGGEITLEIEGVLYKLHGDDPSTLCPVLKLWRKRVERALAHKDGRLELKFHGGDLLRAKPLSQTESWGLTGQRSLRIVCMAGGDLAVWQPDPPADT